MAPNKNITITTNISFKKRHIISPNVSVNDNFKNHCNSESDSSLPKLMCYSPSSRSLSSNPEKDVFDMSVFKAVTPIPSPIDFPTIAWCEEDDTGNSRIEVTRASTSRENLTGDDDDDDDDFYSSHHRTDRYSFISRSKSRKRSLCSLDGGINAPISPVPSMSCSGSCSGLWGHFILPSSDSIDDQTDAESKPHGSSQPERINFKLLPRSDRLSYFPSPVKRARSMSNTFP